MHDALSALTIIARPARVIDRVREHLVAQATALVARTLLQRLDDARRAGALRGHSAEERFAAFVAESASSSGIADIADDVPDMVAWVRLVVRTRRDAVLAMLHDTQSRWEAVTGAVAGARPEDRIEDIDLGTGDTHGGGRSVAVLLLDSGRRVVAKPRDLWVEQGFTRFASWLGERVGIEVPEPTSYSTDLRGWVEHFDGRTPPAHGYPRVAGALLAALYLLDATDIHYENLLTDSRGLPVVVDAETLMTPRIEGLGFARSDGLLGVVATGMLSLRRERADDANDEFDDRAFDPGALAYRPGDRSPFRGWKAVNVGRDDMRLEMASIRVEHPGPAPTAHPRTRAERDELVGGFTDVVSWVLRHRERTLRTIEESFERGSVRYVHRPTMLYHQVLRMATHPAFAGHEARRRVFGRLVVLDPPTPPRLVNAEMRQLAVGDMPSFRVSPRGTSVRDGHGADTGVRCRLSPLDHCLRAVSRLTDEDAEREAEAAHRALDVWGSGESGKTGRTTTFAQEDGAL
ncbi:DUF4135 domain-containing protein [Actinopolyspora xinjiangensis]|uniref:DUF4135 domain-containing protein n=1 Tax=Actinopolyspora xinjiangensis TaxID=405564 RepID=UPI001479D9EE|nr:DUF4135 domain-containing protein [Actinopolyspora xinjiangensis]